MWLYDLLSLFCAKLGCSQLEFEPFLLVSLTFFLHLSSCLKLKTTLCAESTQVLINEEQSL